MKKGEILQGTVSEYKFPNKGIVCLEGRKVAVKGALPGQKISFRLTKLRSGLCEGKPVEVIEKSPLQDAEYICPHFGRCGGCTYQGISYENQLSLKAKMVKELLEGVYPDSDSYFEGITRSPISEGYRNKMEFTFGDEFKGGPFALGLHKKESFHDIVNITDCVLVHPDINLIRNEVRDYFAALFEEGKVDFYNQMRHSGYLRHLLVRRSVRTGQILIALVTSTAGESECCISPEEETEMLSGMLETLKGLPLAAEIKGVVHIYNDGLSDAVKCDHLQILYGQDYITERIADLDFKISVFSFFQTNSLGAEVLYDKAREFASYSGGGVIYDLYSGTGTIAQLMSPVASKVIGVEIVEEAVEAACENACLNRIENVEFIAGDVMKVLCGEMGEQLAKPDFIILDPPREGIHPKALARILEFGVERIIYISCKPTSLVNDLEYFRAAGYELSRAACVDMFPNTVHVETVVLMSRDKE